LRTQLRGGNGSYQRNGAPGKGYHAPDPPQEEHTYTYDSQGNKKYTHTRYHYSTGAGGSAYNKQYRAQEEDNYWSSEDFNRQRRDFEEKFRTRRDAGEYDGAGNRYKWRSYDYYDQEYRKYEQEFYRQQKEFFRAQKEAHENRREQYSKRDEKA
jgi:hypothetical protein